MELELPTSVWLLATLFLELVLLVRLLWLAAAWRQVHVLILSGSFGPI